MQRGAKPSRLAQVVERNIHALLARRRREDRRRSFENRFAAAITAFAGSMPFVYLHVLIYGGWIIANLGWLPIPPVDPTFVTLAVAGSVEAIFLSTFILIAQNRMTALADKRAELDLHVSLLAEHEVTRLLLLVTAIANHLGIDVSQEASEIAELTKDIRPEHVLDTLEQHEKDSSKNR